MVSILTRPEDRVHRQMASVTIAGDSMFQSSPGPKAGCIIMPALFDSASDFCFNPHPARRPGASRVQMLAPWLQLFVSILTRPEGRVHPTRIDGCNRIGRSCFNPHPARRPGASHRQYRSHGGTCFNPHPARRPGASPAFPGRFLTVNRAFPGEPAATPACHRGVKASFG